MDLNKVTLIGNMVRDPEQKSLRTGQSITRFSLATSYAWTDALTKSKREAVDFHTCIAWGRLGDIVQQYVKKGSKLYVEGRLTSRRYVAKDGSKRSTHEIVADNLIMLGHRSVRPTQGSDQLIKDDVDVEEVEDVA
jgi:single-strand DNA-binding protein